MRLLAGLVALATLAGVHPADACGFWSMEDQPKGLTIGWLINSASIEKGDKRWAALYLDLDDPHGIRVTQGHKVVYDIKGDAVRRYGKAIGKVTADGVTFGSHAYTIELADHRLVERIVHAWKLTAKLGDTVVISSEDASSLCSGMKHGMTEDEAAEEVRRRVIYYLAWRETGF
jgi:hypothetical protein